MTYVNVWKRVFDVCCAMLLLVVLSPALLFVAVLVMAASKGPAFFLHERLGRGGKPFRLIKFRTYYQRDCHTGRQLTVADDPRVTPIGKALRAYRIDEWPQLVNVLLGQMSLVGPRPEVAEFVSDYAPEDRDIVLSVRPGITGATQLRCHREAAWLGQIADPVRFYREAVLPQKVKSDRAYVLNLSFWGDASILLQTALFAVGLHYPAQLDMGHHEL